MVRIRPCTATIGLFRHAERLLPDGGALFLYGPYRRKGLTLVPSNVAFDADLRARNPEWGIRLLEDVVDAAAAASLALNRVAAMPSNNLSVVLTGTSRRPNE